MRSGDHFHIKKSLVADGMVQQTVEVVVLSRSHDSMTFKHSPRYWPFGKDPISRRWIPFITG